MNKHTLPLQINSKYKMNLTQARLLLIFYIPYFNLCNFIQLILNLGAVAHVATTPTAYVSLHRSDVNLYLKNGTADIPFACNQAPSGSVSLVGNITGYDNPW